MIGVIGYGSLVNLAQHNQQERQLVDTVPIKFRSYKRIFNQRPAWREKNAIHSAVLNVHYSEPDWLNAVCYCYSNFDFTDLDQRERGYSRMALTRQNITCYRGRSLPDLSALYIYIGKTEHHDATLLPNPDYLQICLKGAKSWGDEFYRDFLSTTHINNGILLSEYINTNPLRMRQ